MDTDQMMRVITPGETYSAQMENNYRGLRRLSVSRHAGTNFVFTLRYYDDNADFRTRKYKTPHGAWNAINRIKHEEEWSLSYEDSLEARCTIVAHEEDGEPIFASERTGDNG